MCLFFGDPPFPNFSKFRISQMLRYVNIILMFLGKSCMFQVFLVIIQRSRCPDLVKIESSRYFQKNIGIHPQAFISHFKPIINHKNPKYHNEPHKIKKTPNCFAAFYQTMSVLPDFGSNGGLSTEAFLWEPSDIQWRQI